MKKNEIAEIIKKGGATLDKNGEAVTFKKGFQVSIKDCFTLDFRDIMQIKKAISGLLKRAKKTGEFVGVWVDGEAVYIDISEYIGDEKKAIEAGKKRQQKAIFNWATLESIYL